MPPPPLPRLDNWSPHASAAGVFSAEDCARILALRGEIKEGRIADSDGQKAYRNSHVSWIRPSPETNWVFAKAQDVANQVNRDCYHMELAGFTEPLQIAEYGSDQYYDWHLDLGNAGFSIRKLSFIVQLSDPANYEGGAVEILVNREAQAIPKPQGTITFFPSYVLHRVCAVTQGTRHSLVGWIGGPHFR